LKITECQPLENMPEGLMKLKNLKEVEVKMRIDSQKNFEYEKRDCWKGHIWQSFKDRQIKIKMEVSDRIGNDNTLRLM
jgi:hypothetical protein